MDWPRQDFLTTDDIINLLNTFNLLGVKSVVFSGGEPFAREDLLEIVKNKGGLKIGVLTSGVWRLKLNYGEIIKNLDLIHFSLDGFSNEVFNLIRGTQGDVCSEVKKNIIFTNNLIKSGESHAKIKINIVKQKSNVDEIDYIIKFCKAYKIPYRISPVHTFDELKVDDDKYNIPTYCVVPYFHCVIDADGEVFFCCHLLNDNDYFINRNKELSLGNILREDFCKIWYGEKAKTMRKHLLQQRLFECRRCDNRYIHINQTYQEYLQKAGEPVFL
jgi:radical SAM protein with 4Fe4S-binding SPASM domain